MTRTARRWAALLTLAAGLSGGASAAVGAEDDYVGRTPPTIPPTTVAARVLGTTESRTVESTTESRTAAAAPGDPIPITGGDVGGLAAIGAGAIAVGGVLLRRGRRASR